MRAVIQRVQHASVSVDGTVRGAIGKGYLVLLGVGAEDDESHMRKVADKMLQLRIFEDENGKINRSLDQVQGELLVISQFTLYADCRKGNRPNFLQAAKPELAERLYEAFLAYCRSRVEKVESGVFWADMKVSLCNDGPFTIVLDSNN